MDGRERQARRHPLRLVGLVLALAVLSLPIQALAGSQVPLKGADRGAFEIVPAACGPGNTWFQVPISGSGNATHLGRYTYEALECFDGVSDYAGTFTLTAANGDTITGTYSGQVVAIVGTVGQYEQDAVVTGGTGRFADASGAFHVSGLADLASLDYTQTLAGWVSSPGAAKK